MVFQIILLLCSIYAIFVQAADLAINSSCEERCGTVSIPYPFGIGAGCYLDHWFEVVCNNNDSWAPKPVLKKLDLEVLNISLKNYSQSSRRTVIVNYPTFSICNNGSNSTENMKLENSPFIFSVYDNVFVAMGCDNFATMTSSDGSVTGCASFCDTGKVMNNTRCSGINCCQTTIASNLDAFNTTIKTINSKEPSIEGCKYAFLVEEKWFQAAYPFSNMSTYARVALEWGIPNTSLTIPLPMANWANNGRNRNPEYDCYDSFIPASNPNSSRVSCYCESGFEGNAYLLGGCKDIDECERSNPCSDHNTAGTNGSHCENTYGSYNCSTSGPTKSYGKATMIGLISGGLGLLVILVGGWWSYKLIKKRRMIKQKNIFKRLLKQHLSSHEANVENTKLFNFKDLDKATDHFNVNRILGQGGQGTVYKGMLVDGRIVAVKKCRVIDEGELKEFINEVVILSQINHRNVVKLIGCCLETEVTLLVYEYIPNGTLFQYVNGQIEEFPLTWNMRLRIATEVAGALFYLHSAASSPIYHRDIKSTNILLDEKYRAKVADFGTSRSITVDQTHLTTLVHGTFGYLDPEYFQSSQFTEKSDVYSFGVVLAELLTGEKAISSTRMQESKSLATYFIQSMEENNLFDILDSQVLKEGKKEEIIAVANLAKMCLYLNGKKRPTMKEVAKELEMVQMPQKAHNLQQNYEELEYDRAEMYEPSDAESKSTMSTSSGNVQPLLPYQSA
ncbi:wall-associated receptor kinase-like 10 [Corylus avellana]|uniref:wall-associated receptor kinase-like 10 n=1 Tax=Corylus avellana TaxID=13451 RepID=UPI00286BF8A9|nr:wall-associated receptor kinase-like 10 [Corylus avellana]